MHGGNKRKKMWMSNFEEIEKALIRQFQFAGTIKVPSSVLVLKGKASEIVKEFGIINSGASNG